MGFVVGVCRKGKGATVGPSDRTGCAFDLQTERLLEKASCSKCRTGYFPRIGQNFSSLNFFTFDSLARESFVLMYLQGGQNLTATVDRS